MDKPLLKFDYVNWRGEDHAYVVEPERIEFGSYEERGLRPGGPKSWVLHGNVITRDGEARSDARRYVGDDEEGVLRRTFMMRGIRNMRDLSREDS